MSQAITSMQGPRFPRRFINPSHFLPGDVFYNPTSDHFLIELRTMEERCYHSGILS